MDYITSAERIGLEKGILQGLSQGLLRGEHKLLILQLKQKFPDIDDSHLKKIEQEQNEKKLCAWAAALVTAKAVEEIFNGI